MTCEDCIHGNICKNEQYFDWSYDCRDFKDKSKFIELPCNVGDTVYAIVNPYISSAYICETKFIVSLFDSFGKTVFLTREEAEAKLKER